MKTVDELFRYGYPAAAAVMFAAFPFNIPLLRAFHIVFYLWLCHNKWLIFDEK